MRRRQYRTGGRTIVAIAIPTTQDDLSLSTTGVQWIVNGYLLALSALFAFGGRLADIAGHRRMVTLGVVVFATASALCGATPSGSLDEPWLIFFRVVQAPAPRSCSRRLWRLSLVLGSILVLENRSNLEATASSSGIPKRVGSEIADSISQGNSAGEAPAHLPPRTQKVVDAIPHDFALASRTVFYGMAAAMVVAFVVALVGMPSGKVETEVEDFGEPTSAGPA